MVLVQLGLKRDADLCVVSGPQPCRPQGLRQECRTVREEWLLHAAEHYSLPVNMPAWEL